MVCDVLICVVCFMCVLLMCVVFVVFDGCGGKCLICLVFDVFGECCVMCIKPNNQPIPNCCGPTYGSICIIVPVHIAARLPDINPVPQTVHRVLS